MTLNEMHVRRIDLRKRLVIGDLSDAEFDQYMDLDHALVKATKPETVARGRVDDFIPHPIA